MTYKIKYFGSHYDITHRKSYITNLELSRIAVQLHLIHVHKRNFDKKKVYQI